MGGSSHIPVLASAQHAHLLRGAEYCTNSRTERFAQRLKVSLLPASL